MSNAIPFLQYSSSLNQYQLSEESKDFLLSIPDSTTICILSIIGKYRTGKSFILNRLISSPKSGKNLSPKFNIGNTINSCTKGLWLYPIKYKELMDNWSKSSIPIQISQTPNNINDNSLVLIIDSEGYGGIGESNAHDNRIFILCLLLSSFLIYNSVGTIDENSLNNMSLIINLSNEIQEKSENFIQFPSLLWILRDFSLKIEDKSGLKMSSKEYLEKALELQKGISDSIEKKNKIRRMLKHFFTDRDCITLIRPIESEESLCKLSELKDDELRIEFIEQISSIKTKIQKKLAPKSIYIDKNGTNKRIITGGIMLIDLCEVYLNIINNSNIGKIEDIWKYVSKNQVNAAVKNSIKEIENIFLSYTDDIFEEKEMIEKKEEIIKGISERFLNKIKGLDIQIELESLLEISLAAEKIYENFFKNNSSKWQIKFQEYINDKESLFFQSLEKIENDAYKDFYDLKQNCIQIEEDFTSKFKNSIGYREFIALQINQILYLKYTELLTLKSTKNSSPKEDIVAIEALKISESVLRTELENNFKSEISQLKLNHEEQIKNLTNKYKSLKEKFKNNQSYKSENETLKGLITNLQEQIKECQRDIMLKCQLNSKENNNNDTQLSDSNKYLSLALQNLENINEKQQIKLRKYKEYKKIFCLSSLIECSKCKRLINKSDFLFHAENCHYNTTEPIIMNNYSYSTSNNNINYNSTIEPMTNFYGGYSLYSNNNDLTHFSEKTKPKTLEKDVEDTLRVKFNISDSSFKEDNDQYNMPQPLLNQKSVNLPMQFSQSKSFIKRNSKIKDEDLNYTNPDEYYNNGVNMPRNLPLPSNPMNYFDNSRETIRYEEEKTIFWGEMRKLEVSVGDERRNAPNLPLFPGSQIKTMGQIKRKIIEDDNLKKMYHNRRSSCGENTLLGCENLVKGNYMP